MSDFLTLMQQIQTKINALGLTYAGNAVQAQIRKLPLREETIDQAVMIVICPGTGEVLNQLAFGGHYAVENRMQVIIISPNMGTDFTGLDSYLDWRQTITNICTTQVTIPNLLFRQVQFDPPIDRQQVSANYDYLALEARYVLYY